jgi:hypothetical protein
MRRLVAVIVGSGLVCAAGMTSVPQAPTAYASLLRAEIARSAKRMVKGGLQLPQPDRSLRVTRALIADVDSDGDLDALAATRSGQVVLWINVGGNRLVRLAPRPKPVGTHHLTTRGRAHQLPVGITESARAFADISRSVTFGSRPVVHFRAVTRALRPTGRTQPQGTRGPPSHA